MVLWELTLATAYFLGLKRTYRLALKIQRRLISSKHHKIRQFLHRRTRAIFDVALKVHRNIQQKDLEVGRSLGTRILRWLDKMKPSANIRGAEENPVPPGQNNINTSASTTTSTAKQASTTTTTSNHEQRGQGGIRRFSTQSAHKGSDRTLFSAATPFFPSRTTQYRQMWTQSYHGGVGFQGVIRKDIMLWMHHN